MGLPAASFPSRKQAVWALYGQVGCSGWRVIQAKSRVARLSNGIPVL